MYGTLPGRNFGSERGASLAPAWTLSVVTSLRGCSLQAQRLPSHSDYIFEIMIVTEVAGVSDLLEVHVNSRTKCTIPALDGLVDE